MADLVVRVKTHNVKMYTFNTWNVNTMSTDGPRTILRQGPMHGTRQKG